MAVSGLAVEPQPEEVVDENFPQLVIQNARERILGDRLLQEKLAENINKILASDPTPQTSKASCSTVEPDQSIDEILGLQGEIHMSDDAIHDILEQTESDPAFQALFDLFDYNKTRSADTGPGDTSSSNTADQPLQGEEDPASTQRCVLSTVDTRAISGGTEQEPKNRKTRKSTLPSTTKKTIIGPKSRKSRIENSTARLLVSYEKPPTVSSMAAAGSKTAEKDSLSTVFDVVVPMDVDESLSILPSNLDSTPSQEAMGPVQNDQLPTSTTVLSTSTSSISVAAETVSLPDVNQIPRSQNILEKTNSQVVNESQSPSVPPPDPSSGHIFSPDVPQESNKAVPQTADLPRGTEAAPSIQGDPPKSSSSTSASASSPAPNPPTKNLTNPGKVVADPSIVSLQIIISDEQDEATVNNKVLNQAISSISEDKIPTIFLSSPAKFPRGLSGTPQGSQDEAAQAVSGLQSSEAHQPMTAQAATLGGHGVVVTSALAGASAQVPPSYIIQLPADAVNPAMPGGTTSYFLVSDPAAAATDSSARQVLMPAGVSCGQPLPSTQYALATPPCSQGLPTGSTFILKSPVHPMMLPASVMGQNTVSKFQMVSNQFVAIPSTVSTLQPEPTKPTNPMTVAPKPSIITRTGERNPPHKMAQPQLTLNAGLQTAPAGSSPSHKRILCFDSAGEAPPLQTTSSLTKSSILPASKTVSLPAKQPDPSNPQSAPRTKPVILGGNKAKRRVETIRSTYDSKSRLALSKQTEKALPPQQREATRKSPRKQKIQIPTLCESEDDVSDHKSLKKSESGNSKSTHKKQNNNNDSNSDQAKSNNCNETQSSRSSDATPIAVSRKDKDEGTSKDSADRGSGKHPEKKLSSQESPSVTANKENEVEGGRSEQQPASLPAPVTLPSPPPQPKSSNAPSKTSSLAKQAAEMLQDIQGHNPPSTPAKRPGAGFSDLPRTPAPGRVQEDPVSSPRTPARPRLVREGEGTPRHLKPPTTPDLPTCSPASEAGSESSINMAAHTLMILSRAAIARTGTPLKDSLRQEGVGEKSTASAKHSKKRKQSAPPSSPPHKKEPKHSSSSKKKERKQKKLLDCFPDDLDVDKFLSSLHYDE